MNTPAPSTTKAPRSVLTLTRLLDDRQCGLLPVSPVTAFPGGLCRSAEPYR